jgi:hypothetical protein
VTDTREAQALDAPEAPDGPRRLSAAAKGWRIALLATLTALFLAGSLKGDDPWWPFGPWRMFSTSQAATGSVWASAIQVETTPGTWFDAPLSPANVGLNRAEVEGRIPQIVADPSMLGTLAASHSKLRPGSDPWIGVRVVRRETVIVNRVPTGQVNLTILATWTTTRPGSSVAK